MFKHCITLTCLVCHRRDNPTTYMYPAGLRKLLNWVTQRYSGKDIYISETGVMDLTDGVRDKTRVEWIREHANEVLKGKSASSRYEP